MVKKSSVMAGDGVVFRLGFRVFFMAAGLWAVLVMLGWMLPLVFGQSLLVSDLSPLAWHGHEMIYAYGLAVIAGFLLTAVKNWTGIPTLHGLPLQGLVLLWLLARLAAFIPIDGAVLAGYVCDALFIVALSVALTVPVVKARLWKNMGVVSKVYFFLPGHVLFCLGQLGLFAGGERMGLLIGLYMILSLILVLSRRVLPMFIERGVGGGIILRNNMRVDIACFVLFLVFAVLDIFFVMPVLTACLAGVLMVLHAVRLSGWYHPGIWSRPLLWVLYLGYAWMVVAFGLKALSGWLGLDPSLALHAFAVGGIGMMSLGMMARVSLGHTGRNIMQPIAGLGVLFALLLASACVRVVLPLLLPEHALLWMGVSQSLWIAAFAGFVYRYVPIWTQPRLDGKPG